MKQFEEREVWAVGTFQKLPPEQILFTPEDHFDEWFKAVEDFRSREVEATSPDILINGKALNFEAVASFDDFADRIEEPGALVLAEHGHLEADIVVSTALISGVVKGNISASESVTVENHAVVIGDINTPRLTIRGGAIIEGDCYFEDLREQENPPALNALKGGLARVWLGRLFQ